MRESLSNSTDLELVLSGFLILMSGRYVINDLFKNNAFSLIDLAIAMYGLYFGAGPWVACWFNRGELPFEETGILIETYLVLALSIVGLALSVKFFKFLNAFSKEESPDASVRLEWFFSRLQTVSFRTVLASSAFVWLSRIYSAVQYGILFSGSGDSEVARSVPYWLTILSNFILIFQLGNLFWYAFQFWRGRSSLRRVSALMLLLEFAYMFLQGRRFILEWIVFVALARPREQYKRMSWLKISILSLSVVVFCAITFPLFDDLRREYGQASTIDGSFERVFDAAQKTTRNVSRGRDFDAYGKNMSSRPLICRFISRICESQERNDLMLGRALTNTFIWVIPYIIYPEKRNYIETEQLIQVHYGQPQFDTSITWPALGCADFGIVGGVFAGLLFGICVLIVESQCLRIARTSPFIAVCILCGLIDLIVFVENEPGNMWVLFRIVLLVYPVNLARRFFST